MSFRFREVPSKILDTLKSISGRDLLLILAAVPTICLFLMAPQTFELSWAGFGELGRGGLFIILFLLGLDLLDFKKGGVQWSLRRKIESAILVAVGILYFAEVGFSPAYSKDAVNALVAELVQGQIDFGLIFRNGLTNFIYAIARVLGANGDYSNSFLMATDFIIDTIYIALLSVTLFTLGVVRRIITPLVFGLGMLLFYLLDAFLPYGSIGPLQFWANFIVAGVALLANLFRLPIYGVTNHLTIDGIHGQYRLVVYWPSVGVQSMLIYSVVMIAVAAKLQAPRVRKAIYAAVGIVVTVLLNVVRVFSIAYYGYAYATSGQQLDAFHNTVGEVLFLIWITAYLFLIIEIENRLSRSPNIKSQRLARASKGHHAPKEARPATEAPPGKEARRTKRVRVRQVAK
jgi:thaumarchaeosortase